jgi:hypothetical protein
MIDFRKKWLDFFDIGDELLHLIRTMSYEQFKGHPTELVSLVTHCLFSAFSYETLNVQGIEKTIHTKLFRSYENLNFI